LAGSEAQITPREINKFFSKAEYTLLEFNPAVDPKPFEKPAEKPATRP
jgi:hypothetical protein